MCRISSAWRVAPCSAARSRATDWLVLAWLPLAEAFEPVEHATRRIFGGAAVLSLAAGLLIWWLLRREKQNKAKAASGELMPAQGDAPVEQKDLSWDDVMPVDIIGLEVGYQLIPLVDKNQGGELLNRIKGVRKKLSQELGFLVPAVHIRDNLDLAPNQYRITLMGVSTGEATVYHDKEMAINPGQVFGQIQGIATQDPAFGLEAVWAAYPSTFLCALVLQAIFYGAVWRRRNSAEGQR